MGCKSNTAVAQLKFLCISSALLVLAVMAAAQNPQHQQHQTPGSPMCPMMGAGPGAMPQHQEMMKLMTQVTQSAAALEKETNPTALKKKAAEHAALVKQLEAKFQQCAAACGQMTPPARGPKATK